MSDESWKIGESPVTFQNWYGGEDFDGQKAQRLKGWDTPEADFTGWRNAVQMQPPKGKLSAKEFLPIRIWEHWTAESVKELPNGNWLVDMGKTAPVLYGSGFGIRGSMRGERWKCIRRRC